MTHDKTTTKESSANANFKFCCSDNEKMININKVGKAKVSFIDFKREKTRHHLGEGDILKKEISQ